MKRIPVSQGGLFQCDTRERIEIERGRVNSLDLMGQFYLVWMLLHQEERGFNCR